MLQKHNNYYSCVTREKYLNIFMEINNMLFSIWKECLTCLQSQLPPKEFSMWILPLKAIIKNDIINLYAPNIFVLQWVKKKYINNFKKLLYKLCNSQPPLIMLQVLHKSFASLQNNHTVYIKTKKKNIKKKKI